MNKRELANQAKAALDAAIAAKKSAEEVATLKADWEAKEAAAVAEEKANIVTLDEIKALVTEAIKAAMPVNPLTADEIAAAVKAAIVSHTKDANAQQAAKADLSNIVTLAVKGALEARSKMVHGAGKDGSTGGNGGRSQTEIPYGLTKGNLCVAYKQLLNCLTRKPMDLDIDEDDLRKANNAGNAMFTKAIDMRMGAKILTSTGSGTGDEWVPTDMSSELFRRLYMSSDLAQLMMASEINMPTDPYVPPVSTTRPTFYVKPTQGTAVSDSTPATAQFSLAAVTLSAITEFSYEVAEDSIIPVLPTVTQLIGEAAADALEQALINGDTTATHQDSDIHAVSNHAAKAWKGFRKLALTNTETKSDLATGGLSAANLLAMIKLMKKWGLRKQDLVWIVGPMGATTLLGLDQVITADKAGPRATIATGTLATLWGIPIVGSEVARENLNASGAYDGSTTTKGSILLVRLPEFKLGNRRGFTVEVDKDIKAQKQFIVSSFRKAFSPVETPSATVPTVICGYNYAA